MRLIIIGTFLLLLTVDSHAMTRLESNAEDAVCELQKNNGPVDTELCHILAQGTEQGTDIQYFQVGESNNFYYIEGTTVQEKTVSNNCKTCEGKITWEGTILKSEYNEKNQLETLSLSNGLVIKIYHNLKKE